MLSEHMPGSGSQTAGKKDESGLAPQQTRNPAKPGR